MMRRLLKLKRSERGSSIVEFAFIAPAFLTFLVAIANLGILFFGYSGLKSAVAEGARFASIFPKPANTLIAARITERRFGMDAANITAPTVTDCTFAGRRCVDIQMTYKVKMNFIFFNWSDITFTENRRVFVYN